MRNSQQQQSSWMNICVVDNDGNTVTLAGYALPDTCPKKASMSCSIVWRWVNTLIRKAFGLAEQGKADEELLTEEQFLAALHKAGLRLSLRVRNPQEAKDTSDEEDEFF